MTRPVRFIFDVVWTRADLDEYLACKMLLKRLLRNFGARCVRFDVTNDEVKQ